MDTQCNVARETEMSMKCERCLRDEPATYRVRTDLIDVKVCAVCAEEARRLGIAVEPLDDKEENNSQRRSVSVATYRLKLSA
jgi:hypothetical protein